MQVVDQDLKGVLRIGIVAILLKCFQERIRLSAGC